MSYFSLDEHKVSSEDFDGEMVAVNFSTGKYYGMKGCAHDIWRMLEQPVTLEEITSVISRSYQVDKSLVEQTVPGFIDLLRSEEVLTVAGERITDQPEPDTIEPVASSYGAPELEIYSDLEELIMLDPVHEADPEHGWPLRRPAEDD